MDWLNQVISAGFNASLNGLAGIFLILGILAVKRRRYQLHAACMLGALGISALFLASYLYYHFVIKGSVATGFASQNPLAFPWVQYLYYAILLSHTLLAMVVAPLAIITAWVALKGNILKHKALARWTFPIWLYVSVTGVIVYLMLYRLPDVFLMSHRI